MSEKDSFALQRGTFAPSAPPNEWQEGCLPSLCHPCTKYQGCPTFFLGEPISDLDDRQRAIYILHIMKMEIHMLLNAYALDVPMNNVNFSSVCNQNKYDVIL